MCVLIGQQVCFRSVIQHENDVSDMIGCLKVVRIYNFMKELKVYIPALYIVFLFVKSENNDFIKETKHVFEPSQSCYSQNGCSFDERLANFCCNIGFRLTVFAGQVATTCTSKLLSSLADSVGNRLWRQSTTCRQPQGNYLFSLLQRSSMIAVYEVSHLQFTHQTKLAICSGQTFNQITNIAAEIWKFVIKGKSGLTVNPRFFLKKKYLSRLLII